MGMGIPSDDGLCPLLVFKGSNQKRATCMKGKIILLFIYISLGQCSNFAMASELGALESKEAVVYSFDEHLRDAQAYLITHSTPQRAYEQSKVEIKIGEWRENGIVFEGMNEPPIMFASYLYENSKEEGIFFPPTEGKIKSLQFYNVPPSPTLVVYYGIDDLGLETGITATIYMTVWVGEHKIKRILVPFQKGWKKETIPLGVAGFLKRSFSVTFEITSDHPNVRRFSFRAAMTN